MKCIWLSGTSVIALAVIPWRCQIALLRSSNIEVIPPNPERRTGSENPGMLWLRQFPGGWSHHLINSCGPVSTAWGCLYYTWHRSATQHCLLGHWSDDLISHSDLWNTCESKALYGPLQVLDSLFLFPWCPVVHFEAPQQFGFRVWAPSPTCHSNSNLVFPWIEIKMHTSFDSCILLLPCPLQTLQSCNNKPSCRL